MNNASLYFGLELLRPKLHSLPFGEACVFSVRAGDKESSNEDSLALLTVNEESGLLVVADGLGGHARGDLASRIAVDSLAAAIPGDGHGGPDLRDAVLRGIDDANSTILSREIGAATTIVVVEVTGSSIRTYHAGDSIALVTGQRGKLKLQTISHSPVGYAVESGLLSEQDAMEADNRHIVSNIVGCNDMRIEIGPQIKLDMRDTLCIASDGLTDNLVIQDIIERIRKGPLLDVAEGLMRECLEKMQKPDGHRDDLSVVLFRPKPARPRAHEEA